jgi:tartrate dehydrogenase/decarboxylase/D-malate dehydrogenase
MNTRLCLSFRFNLDLELDGSFSDWASCDRYMEKGNMLPEDWKQQLEGYDAIYFGAVGTYSQATYSMC